MSIEKFEGFEVKLKELKPEVREMALTLANHYLKQGSEASVAVKRGITEAEIWFMDLEA
jgi:uncharacterized protein YdaT